MENYGTGIQISEISTVQPLCDIKLLSSGKYLI